MARIATAIGGANSVAHADKHYGAPTTGTGRRAKALARGRRWRESNRATLDAPRLRESRYVVDPGRRGEGNLGSVWPCAFPLHDCCVASPEPAQLSGKVGRARQESPDWASSLRVSEHELRRSPT